MYEELTDNINFVCARLSARFCARAFVGEPSYGLDDVRSPPPSQELMKNNGNTETSFASIRPPPLRSELATYPEDPRTVAVTPAAARVSGDRRTNERTETEGRKAPAFAAGVNKDMLGKAIYLQCQNISKSVSYSKPFLNVSRKGEVTNAQRSQSEYMNFHFSPVI